MTDNTALNRRDILQRMTFVMGGALSLSLISACDNGVKAPTDIDGLTLNSLNQNQFDLVGDIADTIIPDTDTLGAKSVNVHYLIDELAANWMRADERQYFLNELTALDERIKKERGRRFSDLDLKERGAVLDQLGQEMLASLNHASLGQGDITNSGGNDENKHIYLLLRELILFGYYTSEVGATQELIYDPVPGDFKGCIPFNDIGKAWAV